MSYNMLDLSEEAQLVWETENVDEKRNILTEAVKGFSFKGQKQMHVKKWLFKVQNATPKDLDFMAAQLALYKDFKVV